MNKNTLNIIIAGKGGQGIIVINEILANIFLEKKFDIKTSEIHGMAQRGGSVVSHVRCGTKVYSPTIPIGEAHYILALSDNEGLRWKNLLRDKGKTLQLSQKEINSLPNVRMKNIALLSHLVFHLQKESIFEISSSDVKKQIEKVFNKKPVLLENNLKFFDEMLKRLENQ